MRTAWRTNIAVHAPAHTATHVPTRTTFPHTQAFTPPRPPQEYEEEEALDEDGRHARTPSDTPPARTHQCLFPTQEYEEEEALDEDGAADDLLNLLVGKEETAEVAVEEEEVPSV